MDNNSSISNAKDWASLPGWARGFAAAFVVAMAGAAIVTLMP